jgi:hypothetical protein
MSCFAGEFRVSYDAAINKAWKELEGHKIDKDLKIKFFSDEYQVDTRAKKLISVSTNIAAKDFVSILALHYLKQSLAGLPKLTGQWISFRELSSGEHYFPAFRKRSIELVLRKYGSNPKGIFNNLDKLSGKKISQADAAVMVEAFSGVPLLVEIWAGDDEFAPEANLLFDKNIENIFCTEDVAVLGGFAAKYV